MNGMSTVTPGPRTPIILPRRKMTIRLYSGTTRTGRNTSRIRDIPVIAIVRSCGHLPFDGAGLRLRSYSARGLDDKRQTAHSGDADLASHREPRRGGVSERRAPHLAAHAHLAVGIERLGDLSGRADHPVDAGHHRRLAGAYG